MRFGRRADPAIHVPVVAQMALAVPDRLHPGDSLPRRRTKQAIDGRQGHHIEQRRPLDPGLIGTVVVAQADRTDFDLSIGRTPAWDRANRGMRSGTLNSSNVSLLRQPPRDSRSGGLALIPAASQTAESRDRRMESARGCAQSGAADYGHGPLAPSPHRAPVYRT